MDSHAQSEVASLLAQIHAEYESAQQGVTGLALGTSHHAFITAKMERMSTIHTALHALVGDQAIILIAAQLEATPEPKTKRS